MMPDRKAMIRRTLLTRLILVIRALEDSGERELAADLRVALARRRGAVPHPPLRHERHRFLRARLWRAA